MQTVKIPISSSAYSGVDGIELQDLQAEAYDCFVDELGATRKRPGIEELADLGTNLPVDGVFYWDDPGMSAYSGIVLTTSGGSVFKAYSSTIPSIATKDLTGVAKKLPPERTVFCRDGDKYAFMASGGEIGAIVGSDLTSKSFYVHDSDADAPQVSTHVGYIDGYLLSIEGDDNQFVFSEVNDSFAWDALDFASGAGNADDIKALYILNREVYLIGGRTVEKWENNGEDPFRRVPGGFLETGCIAPYSIIPREYDLFWLDDSRRFVQFDGQSVQKIATPIDKRVQGLSTVSNCWGVRLQIAGQELLVWTFPTEGLTFCYNTTSNTWTEWGKWDSANSRYNLWAVNCATFVPAWGFHVAGGHDGKLYKLTEDAYDDDGDAIRVHRKTGHIDYGTKQKKRSKEIRLRVKRGASGSSGSPKLMFRWMDNNSGKWSSERYIDLGNEGDTEIVARIHARGIYRTRQYEFTATDSVPIIFLDAEEDIEVLG